MSEFRASHTYTHTLKPQLFSSHGFTSDPSIPFPVGLCFSFHLRGERYLSLFGEVNLIKIRDNMEFQGEFCLCIRQSWLYTYGETDTVVCMSACLCTPNDGN